jgi:hypothetical protein
MSQIEDSEEKRIKAIRQQVLIYENIKKIQQEELNQYFTKIMEHAKIKQHNVMLKMQDKDF